MAKVFDPRHLPPFSAENPRPQCPAELRPPYGIHQCHLLFGHDGPHIHFTEGGNEVAFVVDERPSGE